MPRRRNHEFRIGGFYLCRKPGSPFWHVGWNDPAHRATGPRRRSLGTDDLEAAKIALARFATLHGTIRNAHPADMTIAQVAARYVERHAGALPSADVTRRALALWLDHFGAAVISDLTHARQEGFVAALARRGHGSGYIKRTLAAGAAALRWAYKRGELANVPHIITVPDSKPRDRIFDPAEAAAFWRAIDDQHLALFFLLGLNTAGRPGVLLKLSPFQIDLGRGLLDLHPPGATITTKRNSVVRITATLRPWLEAMPARERFVGRAAKCIGDRRGIGRASTSAWCHMPCATRCRR